MSMTQTQYLDLLNFNLDSQLIGINHQVAIWNWIFTIHNAFEVILFDGHIVSKTPPANITVLECK